MKLLKSLLRLKTDYKYNRVVEHEDYKWNDDDAIRLHQFFQEETGQKLKAILENYVIKVAVVATQSRGNFEYACGMARGVAMAVETLQSHFASLPRRADTTEVIQQPSVAEQLALN